MNRPAVLHVGGTLYWVVLTRNPDTMVLKDADSTPTVAVRKNGASVGDSVTITKRSATTGIYDCSYNPASEIEGDKFTLEESVTITGTTTAQATYQNNWDAVVIAPVAEIQSGLATTTQLTTVEGKIDTIDDFVDTEVSAIKGVTDKLDTTVEVDGAVYRFTTNALEQAPSGSTTVQVAPLQSVAPNRVAGTEIVTYLYDVSAIGPIAVTDADGTAIDLSALTLKVCIEKIDGTVLANVTPTISGGSGNQVTFTPNADSVAKTGTYRWSLRQTSNNQVYALGDFVVDPAARIS